MKLTRPLISFGHVKYRKFLIVKQLIKNSRFHYHEVIINDYGLSATSMNLRKRK